VSEALGEFLRSRRARLSPAAAGLPAHGHRRVPGLRREEVARLAGVSVDYYTRLERGRDVNVSQSVLDALARALRLSETERGYLVTLASPVAARRGPLPPQRVRPGLARLLTGLTTFPAVVVGRRLDVLASNTLANALFTDFSALPHRERNMARFIFTDDAARSLYVDWPGAARSVVGTLRLHAGKHPNDPLLAELVADLSRDEDFRRWWAEQEVSRRTYGGKHYLHPVVGELHLDYEALALTGDPDQVLGVNTAEPGSVSEERLRLLADWASARV
jgi:transcriptional regulator with XRE-family HTH domain